MASWNVEITRLSSNIAVGATHTYARSMRPFAVHSVACWYERTKNGLEGIAFRNRRVRCVIGSAPDSPTSENRTTKVQRRQPAQKPPALSNRTNVDNHVRAFSVMELWVKYNDQLLLTETDSVVLEWSLVRLFANHSLSNFILVVSEFRLFCRCSQLIHCPMIWEGMLQSIHGLGRGNFEFIPYRGSKFRYPCRDSFKWDVRASWARESSTSSPTGDEF